MEKYVEIIFILDRSGSMSGLEDNTIKGFNSMLKKQKKEKGNAFVTTVLFDDKYELLHDRISIQEIKPFSHKEYFTRGSTALLDAFGKTINNIKHTHKALPKKDHPEKVVFIIITDGEENSSQEYSYQQVQSLVKSSQKKGFDFIFLGANIDAIAEARKFSIPKCNASNYHADEEGTELNFKVLSDTLCDFREAGSLKANWSEEILSDFKKRKKQ